MNMPPVDVFLLEAKALGLQPARGPAASNRCSDRPLAGDDIRRAYIGL